MEPIYNWFEAIYKMDIQEIYEKFPLLEEGSCRKVFAISDELVIKLATNDEGIHQCRVEYKVYNKAKRHLREYLCPVLWHKYAMVVMERATPLTKITFAPYIEFEGIGHPEQVYRDLRELSRKHNLLFEDIMSTTSWGILGGKPVLIDYGCTDR